MGSERVKLDEPLSSHTTLRIGGPADLFYEAHNSGELIKAVRLARSFEVPVTIIGGGSNVLVSDVGVRGLVVKNCGGEMEIRERTMRYDFSDLDYDESEYPDVEVAIDSGVSLQAAMFNLFEHDITGLQWYARIPGTVGGAVFNNIHGGNHVFSEIVKDVVLLTKHGDVIKIPAKSMRFEYDTSRIHQSGEIVLEVVLNLKKGNVEKARAVADEWRRRKSSQPFNSAGCVFKNISEKDREILGYPTTATGYIVEHILNMTGYKVGGAMISPNHHNFIVNTGGATAKDYLAVRDEIVKRAKETIGMELEDEIIRMGEFNY
ncbi:MAG: UDP-N-acetylenolpyruvoylglucosamine reductase [Candidatus Collierbacteria bacterium GW2011_GWB2_44_22]|uniref:UDP-N-acetylenolpyruvoylglucosamine reductase n=1 Tax=Candidatus Collierbacteria bacterium GW2011_GWB2_44_22 TaxID=1618387 RepID=A0A0G1HZ51_9BACT|nr:MAG: UDP-N-acetylenolpyruvoylglucosamine reductase [Candidatus Collierbacteria bacterium GW2011_GWB2_44_22]